jgi:glycosyltransferase involved in cell wall biosynthesis
MSVLFSAVINIHNEGLWARKAIRSARKALTRLREARPDQIVELIVVADRAEPETLRIASQALDEVMDETEFYVRTCLIKTDFGDLGLARNAGVLAAEGSEFIGFLDGDDLWGEDWPLRAVEDLERIEGTPAVAHPFLNVDFGAGAFWWTQPDQRSPEFDPALFWNTNCWSSGACAKREVFMQHPYKCRTPGLGFEDWEWNARTVAAGVLHISVARAVVFIRKKNDGLNAESAAKKQIVAHSPYFENDPDMMPRHKAVPISEPATVSLDWLMPQWQAAHRIEPELWPDMRAMQDLPRYKAQAVRAVPVLARMIAGKVKQPPTHIILAPHLVQGGADKRIVLYAEAITSMGGRPLIILTDRASDDSWTNSLPDNVHLIDASGPIKQAGDGAGMLALTRLIMWWKPTVHIVNSRIGYGLVARYGNALRDSRVPLIACSLYGSEETDGKLGGAAFNGWFFDAHKHIDLVISDNGAHLNQIREVHGWLGRTETVVAPTPAKALSKTEWPAVQAARQSRMPALRVLWASRIVKGKRLDRLLAVAKLAHEQKEPILFAVAGEVGDEVSKRVVAELRKLPNVKVAAKPFDGWKELAPTKHDLFMFTSESEGMPNVVLEALGYGLPVISTDVGDVKRTPARIVIDADNPEKWLKKLLHPAVRGLPEQGIEYVRHNHSRAEFISTLDRAGYFTNTEEDNGRTEDDRDADTGTNRSDANGSRSTNEEEPSVARDVEE